MDTERIWNRKISKNPVLKYHPRHFLPNVKNLSYISYFMVQKEIGKFSDAFDISIIKARCQQGKVTQKRKWQATHSPGRTKKQNPRLTWGILNLAAKFLG